MVEVTCRKVQRTLIESGSHPGAISRRVFLLNCTRPHSEWFKIPGLIVGLRNPALVSYTYAADASFDPTLLGWAISSVSYFVVQVRTRIDCTAALTGQSDCLVSPITVLIVQSWNSSRANPRNLIQLEVGRIYLSTFWRFGAGIWDKNQNPRSLHVSPPTNRNHCICKQILCTYLSTWNQMYLPFR